MMKDRKVMLRYIQISVLLTSLAAATAHSQWISAGTKPNAVVAADGSGTHKTVQEAINAAPAKAKERFFIQIKPGTYKEKLVVPKDKGPISFYSGDAKTTILTYDDYAGKKDASDKPL